MPLGLKRFQDTGHSHIVTFSCCHRLPHLDADPARIIFEEMLETLRTCHSFSMVGYVLMPEHVHLLLGEPTIGNLASTLRVLKGETPKRLKGGRDHFWQRRYYDFNVFTQAKRIEKLKYIHRNPVLRGLVAKPEDWPGAASTITQPVSEGECRSIPNGSAISNKARPTHRNKTAMNGAPGKSFDWKCPAEVFLPNFDFVQYWHRNFNPVALRT